MSDFQTMSLPEMPSEGAPDGSDVRILLRVRGGAMSHFALGAGKVSRAVRHRTVEEVWYVLAGKGEMWRKQGDREEVVVLEPGVCLTIPIGTHFQFRACGAMGVAAIGVTMPPWPGDDEAVAVDNHWPLASQHESG